MDKEPKAVEIKFIFLPKIFDTKKYFDNFKNETKRQKFIPLENALINLNELIASLKQGEQAPTLKDLEPIGEFLENLRVEYAKLKPESSLTLKKAVENFVTKVYSFWQGTIRMEELKNISTAGEEWRESMGTGRK